MKDKTKCDRALDAIERELSPIVFRNWPRWRDVLSIAPRTVANDDSRGEGPEEKVYMGRNVGYPRAAFMKYLKKKMKG